MADYRTLLAKMKADIEKNDAAEKCLELMLDPYSLLGMAALIPLFDAIDTLVTFAQKQVVYVCNFVAALKFAEGQLYTLYVDRGNAYGGDEFWAFRNRLDCSHSQIHTKLVLNLNDESEQLVFMANGETVLAIHNCSPAGHADFDSVVALVKTECSDSQNVITHSRCAPVIVWGTEMQFLNESRA